MAKNIKLSPPWCTFVNELKALFGQDKEIQIDYREEDYEVRLYVTDAEKAEALTQLIPEKNVFGNVCLKVTVIPANNAKSGTSLIEKAFKGNPVFKDLYEISTPFGRYGYVMLQNKVVQFYNDELNNPYGLKSTLYEDIARDVFGDCNFFFCTDTEKEND